MKKTILVGVLQCLVLVLFAAEPAGYYNSAEGKSGETLRQALFSKIKDHYNVGYDGLYNVYPTSDVCRRQSVGYVFHLHMDTRAKMR